MTNTELMAKLVEHMEKQEVFGFSIVKKEDGTVSTAYEFGREAPDSPMVGAASYGIGRSIEAALTMNVEELRL